MFYKKSDNYIYEFCFERYKLEKSTVASQLAWTYRNFKQQWAHVTQKINHVKNFAIDSIIERGKGSMVGEHLMHNKL